MASKRRTKQIKNQPIVARPAITTASGIVVADWQRLPKQLLQEHLQKTKTYARPDYHNAKCFEDGKYRCRVILRHLKQDERSLTFCPEESFDTFDLGKEWAALLALKHLCGDLALERKLPDPFRTGWLSLSTSTPVVTTRAKFHSEFDRQQVARESTQNKSRSQNIKEARKHFQKGQRTRLTIDDEHHRMLEHVVLQNKYSSIVDSDRKRSMIAPGINAWIQSELLQQGFQHEDIDLALNETPFSLSDRDQISIRNAILSWILIHIPERRIPASFRSKQSSAIVIQSGTLGDFHNLSLIDQLRRLGYPSIACQIAISKHPDSYQDAKLWLYQNMIEFLSDQVSIGPTNLSADELESDIESERLALSAIYEDAFEIITDRCWIVHLHDLKLSLHIDTNKTRYPAAVPFIGISSDFLSAADRILIEQVLITQVALKAAVECSPTTHACIEFLLQISSEQILQTYRARWPDHWLLSPIQETSPSPLPSRKTPQIQQKTRSHLLSNEALSEKWQQRYESVQYAFVLKGRSRLPVWRHRHRLIEAIHTSQVVVICAETGSGKSTQIPAFLLDQEVERGQGAQCRVICTQPRRISAVSLAERVAHEYCEKVGETVGYRIRLETKISQHTQIEYVTNGLLLRQLLSDSDLQGVSHVVLDEVHERSVEIDLLLFVLRQVLQRRSNLRLILMSATVQSDLLSSYFNGCPVVQVPGRAFPVDVIYVEDLIESTGYHPSATYRVKSHSADSADLIAADVAVSDKTRQAVASLNPDMCNIDLIIIAIWHIISRYSSETGAILCFLPGVGEINSSMRQVC